MSETQSTKQPLPLWRRIALTLIVLIIIAMTLMMMVSYLLEIRLDGKIGAIEKAGHPVSFKQLATPPADTETTEKTAAIYTYSLSTLEPVNIEGLSKALAILGNAISANALDKLPPDFQPDVTKALNQHLACLQNLDTAAALPLAGYDTGLQYSLPTALKSLDQARKAIILLSIRTKILIASKKYDEAAGSINTMLKTARVFDSSLIISVSNIKQHFIRLACGDIQTLIRRGKPSDTAIDKLAKTLTEVVATDTIKNTLLAEQVFQIENSRNFLSKKTSEKFLQTNIPELPSRPILPNSSLGKIKARLLVLSYFDEMDKLIRATSKSPSDLLEYLSNSKKKMPKKLQPYIAAPYAFVETSIASSAIIKSTALILHIEKFKLTNAKLPNSLADIAASVDPLIMIDPYSNKSMLYKKEETSYTVYSTGPNKTDNGGSVSILISKETGQIEKKPEDIGLKILIPKKP